MLNPEMEKAWQIDEAVMRQKSIERAKHFDHWGKLIEEARRLQSNAYARPTKFIPAVKKPLIPRIKYFFRCFLP